MKLNKTNAEVDVLGKRSSQEYGIDPENLHLAYKAFTQYSDPISAVVREVTSNCFDAHREARVDKNIKIEISDRYTDDRYISFRDYGIGLTVDRVNNIYRKFFSSTKRDTNEQIGAFGLGSKSPLGYTEMFEVITSPRKPCLRGTVKQRGGVEPICMWFEKDHIDEVFRAVKYHYIIREGKNSPSISLVNTSVTNEEFGTEVVIPIHNSTDWKAFVKACKEQLAYFSDITFSGPFNANLNEKYDIIEGENFRYIPDGRAPDTMHLVLGEVYYPIDHDIMDWSNEYSWKASKYDVGIALKFDIGELDVVWNRENIEYNEAQKKIIQKRADAAFEELKDLDNKYLSKIDSFEKWYNVKDTVKKYYFISDNVKIRAPKKETNDLDPNTSTFGEFNDLPKLPNNVFYFLNTHRSTDDKGHIKSHQNLRRPKGIFGWNGKFTKATALDVYYLADESYQSRTNRYICQELSYGPIFLLKRDKTSTKYYEKVYRSYYGGDDDPTKKEVDLIKKFENLVLDKLSYLMYDYSSVEVTEEFIEKDKERKTSSTTDYSDELPCKLLTISSNYYESYKWSRERLDRDKLENFNGIIIYGNNDHDDALTSLGDLIYGSTAWIRSEYPYKLFSNKSITGFVLKVGKNRYDYLKSLPCTTIHVNEIEQRIDELPGLFKRMVTARKIKEMMDAHPHFGYGDVMHLSSSFVINYLFPDVYKLASEIDLYKSNNMSNWGGLDSKRFKSLVDVDMIRKVETLIGYMYKIPSLTVICNISGVGKNTQTVNQKGDEILEIDTLECLKNQVDDIHPLLYYRYNENKLQEESND